MSVDILGTSWDQCRSMVQYSFTSTETRRLVWTDSPGRPPRLSHSSWICDSKWVTVAFYCAFWIATQVVYLQRFLVVTWPVPRKTAAVSARSVYTIQPCTMHHDTSCKATYVRCMRVNLAVTCQLHFWQNDRDLLHATAVIWGMERIPHRKLTLEEKFSRRSCRDSNPRSFNHESGTLTMDL